MEFEYKLVVAVREDLGLTAGKMAVQVAHAAVACSNAARRDHHKWYSAWMEEGQRKVVVRAMDLTHLNQIESKAKSLELSAEIIQDAGLTEVPPGTVTCVGIGPAPDHMIDKVTGNLKLMG